MFMRLALCFLFLASPQIARAIETRDGDSAARRPVIAAKPIQHVVISFDGAGNLDMWDETRRFAKHHDIHFTYFLSCTYLLTWENRTIYNPPRRKRGRSNIGFAKSADEIAGRLAHINMAIDEGHEIASHGCGHFNGTGWTASDWHQEFHQFRTILANAYANNALSGEPEKWSAKVVETIAGFRAPYLARGRHLDTAMSEAGFRYDASGVGPMTAKPGRTAHGLWDFHLAVIPEGPGRWPIVSMDYNLYYRHSKARPAPAKADQFQARTYAAVMHYFDVSYSGDRAPIHIGMHFAKWNKGAYWKAVRNFAQSVCRKPDVKCTTYRALADTLDTVEIADMAAGN